MFYNYTLYSAKLKHWYIGRTKDLKRRLEEHNQGLNLSTKSGRPWKLIYYEACVNELDSIRRERYLKTTQGGRLLKRRLRQYLYEQKEKDLVD